jgi:hypothetical protein
VILGIMQPYFFPYIGYYALIARTDRWVVFDVVQYNARSWMNRNRVLHPRTGWQYVGVPVHHAPKGTPIHDISLQDKDAALARLLGQIEHYRRHAPHFPAVVELVRGAFARTPTNRLVDLNVATLAATCDYLGVAFDESLCSEMNLHLEGIEHAGQWALRISAQLGASTYLNPPGGRDIFRPAEWAAAGIAIGFVDPPPLRYDCRPYAFVEHLSILDVLMWNRPDTVAAALREHVDAR